MEEPNKSLPQIVAGGSENFYARCERAGKDTRISHTGRFARKNRLEGQGRAPEEENTPIQGGNGTCWPIKSDAEE